LKSHALCTSIASPTGARVCANITRPHASSRSVGRGCWNEPRARSWPRVSRRRSS
jgi:hypothetical protein